MNHLSLFMDYRRVGAGNKRIAQLCIQTIVIGLERIYGCGDDGGWEKYNNSS